MNKKWHDEFKCLSNIVEYGVGNIFNISITNERNPACYSGSYIFIYLIKSPADVIGQCLGVGDIYTYGRGYTIMPYPKSVQDLSYFSGGFTLYNNL